MNIQKLNAGSSCSDPQPGASVYTKWDFGYDGDGVRVETMTTTYVDGLPQTTEYTKYYFGGAYEVRADNSVVKYYSFGGTTIMRDASGLHYMLTDHPSTSLRTGLGSVVAVTNSAGTLESEQRYLPFGQVRADVGSISQTDYGYTGQRALDSDMGGIMDYRARFYSPMLGRFLQPDTIVPNAANPQNFNRYSYVGNNPIGFNDPTGHMQQRERGDEGKEGEQDKVTKRLTSRCGAGANMEQIAIAFDEKHDGKGYSVYYASIHGVVQDLDKYLENINTEYEGETDDMRDKRISRFEERLKTSVDSARITGQSLHYGLTQDAWTSDAEFPKILGGGLIIDNSSGTLGDGTVAGSGEFSSVLISNIVNYYTHTPPPSFFLPPWH